MERCYVEAEKDGRKREELEKERRGSQSGEEMNTWGRLVSGEETHTSGKRGNGETVSGGREREREQEKEKDAGKEKERKVRKENRWK